MHSVCGIHGGFSNHARWLMLLSNEYNNESTLNSYGYIIQKAKFPTNSQDKVNFILEHIYNNNRTCFNWLAYEHIHIDQISKIIKACHQMASHHKLNFKDIKKTLLLRCDTTFANEKWFKFTPWIIIVMHNTGTLPEDYRNILKSLDEENGNFVHSDSDHKTFISRSELLYNETLDENFYNGMTEFFNISNELASAKEMHSAWYKLQIKAKAEFLDWLYNAEFPNFPWYGHWLQADLKMDKKNMKKEDYEICKNYLKKMYGELNA